MAAPAVEQQATITMMPTIDDIHRVELKLDSLMDAVTKLVLFEERQAVQALAITGLTARVTMQEKTLAQWVNRGIGVWAFAITAFAVFQSNIHILQK